MFLSFVGIAKDFPCKPKAFPYTAPNLSTANFAVPAP